MCFRSFRTSSLGTAFGFFLLLAACENHEPNATADSGSEGARDAGNAGDAGDIVSHDSGLDAGSEPITDAGYAGLDDAGMMDSGIADSGIVDSGPETRPDAGPTTYCPGLQIGRQRWSGELFSDENSCGFFALSLEARFASVSDYDYRLARAMLVTPGTRDTDVLISGPLTVTECDETATTLSATLSGEGVAPAPYLDTSFVGSYQRAGSIRTLDITVRLQTSARGEIECTGRMRLE